jgi:hypothetical protein
LIGSLLFEGHPAWICADVTNWFSDVTYGIIARLRAGFLAYWHIKTTLDAVPVFEGFRILIGDRQEAGTHAKS